MSKSQLEAARRMLRELSELAEHASLTGAMEGGAGRAAARYNSCLETLEDEDSVPHGLFSKIDERTAEFGQIAVDARLLLATLNGDNEDEDDDDCDRRGRHRDRDRKGKSGVGALIALAPFLD